MKAKIFNYSENEFKTTDLNENIWNSNFKPILISLYNRYNLFNKRNSISNTKTKAEVSGGGRKPWSQKGTGRARQGSIRSPQWKGGGVVFGPTNLKNYSIKMNKKEKTKALSSIFSEKINQEKLIIIENFVFVNNKTKQAVSLIEKLKISDKNNVFILSSNEIKNNNFNLSFRNISKTSLIETKNFDITKIINADYIIITEESLSEIESLLSKN